MQKNNKSRLLLGSAETVGSVGGLVIAGPVGFFGGAYLMNKLVKKRDDKENNSTNEKHQVDTSPCTLPQHAIILDGLSEEKHLQYMQYMQYERSQQEHQKREKECPQNHETL